MKNVQTDSALDVKQKAIRALTAAKVDAVMLSTIRMDPGRLALNRMPSILELLSMQSHPSVKSLV